MFAGGLTPIGFVDFFKYIMPLDAAKKRYFLKGASGSGKSTFIKKIAEKFDGASTDIDFFHCANDASGLDGLAVKDLGFCIIDATSPHSHDPEIPSAIDEIIDFAEFLDSEKLTEHIDEIKKLLESKKELYKNAQKFLTAAGSVRTADRAAYEATVQRSRVRDYAREYLNGPETYGAGTDRKLFLSAITPAGLVNFAEDVLSRYNVYDICAKAGSNVFLDEMKCIANSRGINTESFFSPLEPTKREYLLLPEEGLAFSATHSICSKPEIIKTLLDAATEFMKEALVIHGKIEEIYIDKMNFDKVNELTEKILNRL